MGNDLLLWNIMLTVGYIIEGGYVGRGGGGGVLLLGWTLYRKSLMSHSKKNLKTEDIKALKQDLIWPC